jgi:glutaredoxin
MYNGKIVKFSTRICGQCTAMELSLKALNVEFENIFIDEAPENLDISSIKRVPTLIKYDKDGHEIARIEGHTTLKEYKKFLGL